MRVLGSLSLVLFCAVASIAWAQAPTKKANQLKPGDVYKLDTGDVVAIFSGDAKDGGRNCELHVVQMDGTLHLHFAKVDSRGKTITEVRDSIKQHSKAAQQHGMGNVVATIVDLRNSGNDHILQNLE
jgi:protein involved in polysaccharide export with SLBB domain